MFFTQFCERLSLIIADLKENRSAFFEMPRTNGKESAIEDKSVRTAVKRNMRFVLHLWRKRCNHSRFDIGRIRDDQIEFALTFQKIFGKNISFL